MTYVPPEKRQRGGTGGFGDVIYVILFLIIEGVFIFIVVPFLILVIAILPLALYVIISEGQGVQWALYLIAVVIVFLQVLALQFFFRRYFLEPHKMTFGQWLRYSFYPKEIQKRRRDKLERSRKLAKWYDGMEKVEERKQLIKEEQSYDLRGEWFRESGDPELIATTTTNNEAITIGKSEEKKEE